SREQVVRIEHGRLGGIFETVAPERADVGVGAHEAAVVALEAAQAPDRLRAAVFEVEAAVLPAGHDGHGQVWGDPVRHGDRTGAGAAAAVRLGEGLVQVEVHDVEAHVPRTGDAHHRVEVG